MTDHIVIAVRFGDNDYHSTFRICFQTIAHAWIYGSAHQEEFFVEDPTLKGCDFSDHKRKALDMLNRLIYPIYLLSQSHQVEKDEESDFMRKYLEVKMERFLFGAEELEDYQNKRMDDNSSTFVLDTRLPKDQQFYCF